MVSGGPNRDCFSATEGLQRCKASLALLAITILPGLLAKSTAPSWGCDQPFSRPAAGPAFRAEAAGAKAAVKVFVSSPGRTIRSIHVEDGSGRCPQAGVCQLLCDTAVMSLAATALAHR